jgi:hypothetical protein
MIKNENGLTEELNILTTKVINKYISSNIKNTNQFCLSNKIKRQSFDRCVEYVKKYMPELYGRYVSKICNIKKETYESAIVEVNKVVPLIKSNESFDLFDYFFNTKLNPRMFVAIAKVICQPGEINISFGNLLYNQSCIDKNLTLKTKQAFKDFFVEGENYEVPVLAKEKVMTFLENHQIPLYPQVYSIALKRYLKGDPLL